jgi:hypothetical protein
MYLALNKSTQLLIEAEDLRFISKKDMPEFCCPDENCGIPFIPASYQIQNKNRPHFRKNGEHSDKCKLSKYAKLLETGSRRRITLEEFENMPVPTKLVKPKLKKTVDENRPSIVSDIDETSSYKTKGNNGVFDETNSNFKNVTTISQITDFYLKFYFNRDIELDLLGTVKQYRYWFKQLKNTLEKPEPQEYKIYIGQLSQKSDSLVENDKEIRIRLYDCERLQEISTGVKSTTKLEQVNPFFLTISKDGLSANKITRIKHEMEYALHDQKKAYLERIKSKDLPLIFFLGRKKSADNRFEYEVLEGYFVARYATIKQTVSK